MNCPSGLAILWLFARTAVRRTTNSSAAFQKLIARRQAGDAPQERSATIARGQGSAASQMMGWFILGSMIFGGLLLFSVGIITVIEAVRLDDMASTPRMVLPAEELAKLSTAAAAPEAERAEAIKTTLEELSHGWAGTWTKTRFVEIATKRFEERGIEGFEAGEASLFEKDFALMTPEGRTRALRSASLFLALFNFGMLSMALSLLNRGLSGSDPLLSWLMQFPVSRRLLALSRLIEQIFDTPAILLNTVLAAIVLSQVGAGFWDGLVLSVSFGVGVALCGAAFRMLIESLLLGMPSRSMRGAVLSTVTSAGGLVLLFAMLGSGAAITMQAIVWVADHLPAAAWWNPLGLGFGSPDLLREHPFAWCGGMLLMSAAAGVLAVWSSASIMERGLSAASDSGRTRVAAPARAGWSHPFRGLLAKEWLNVIRKPELLVQVLLSPLLILGLIYFQNPEKSLNLMTRDAGAICTSIFAVAAYVLTGAAGALLAIEFRTLWFLQTFPRSIADSVRTKARFWGTVVLLPVAGVAIWTLIAKPDALAQLGLRIPFLLAYTWFYAEITFGVISLGASVPTEGTVRFRRSMWFLPALAMLQCSTSLYVGDFWSLAGTLIILVLISVAVRQRQVAELPWISDPSDAPPRQLDAAHALIALGSFLQVRDILGGILAANDFAVVPRSYLAFCGSAAIVTLVVLIWQRQSHLVKLPPLPRGPALKPILVGLAICCSVGFAWTLVLKRSPDIVASAHLSLQLPTSVETFDREACLRILALLIVAPIFEEWLFRGLLYKSLRKSWGVGVSVALSALLFTVIHPFTSSVGVMTLAIVTPLVYERTGRLWASMLVHFGYNLSIMAIWTTWSA